MRVAILATIRSRAISGRAGLTVLSYPAAPMGADADDYHGDLVADPYRWLESIYEPSTASWVAAQNELTEAMLAQCTDRAAISDRLTELVRCSLARARPALQS
jgi:Prolyl oligopeptidase, N-terminal beta-propeller domain